MLEIVFPLLLLAVNVPFFVTLATVYVCVSRRRWKLYMLVEHLATLARQGLPLQSGLRALGHDLGGYLGTRVTRVAQHLEEGRTLGEAFDAAPLSFPPLLRSMLRIGDQSGNLAATLEELRRSYRRLADLPAQSVYLFIYPLLLSLSLNLTLTGLYIGIVPKFEVILEQIKTSTASHQQGWSLLLMANEAILVLCITLATAFVLGGTSLHFGSSIAGWLKRAADRVLLGLPVLRGILRDAAVQQFALCAGLLLRAGAALPEALLAAAGVERNSVLRRRLEGLAARVSEGERLSVAAQKDGLGGEDLRWFLETGEHSGLLADHLHLAASHYETKVRLAGRLISGAVVPGFVVLNGLIVFAAFLLTFVPVREVLFRAIHANGPF